VSSTNISSDGTKFQIPKPLCEKEFRCADGKQQRVLHGFLVSA
jgi:hypothetical protein